MIDAPGPLIGTVLHLQDFIVGFDDGDGCLQLVPGIGNELPLFLNTFFHRLSDPSAHEPYESKHGSHVQQPRENAHGQEQTELAQLLVAADSHDLGSAVIRRKDLIHKVIETAFFPAGSKDLLRILFDIFFRNRSDVAVIRFRNSAVRTQRDNKETGFIPGVRGQSGSGSAKTGKQMSI